MYVTTSASQNRRRENEIIVRSDLKCSVPIRLKIHQTGRLPYLFPGCLCISPSIVFHITIIFSPYHTHKENNTPHTVGSFQGNEWEIYN